MKDYKGELVLVVKRELFNKIGNFQGFSNDIDKYLSKLINPDNNFFMDRGEAEENTNYKQLIPYAIFTYNGKLMHYKRGKSGGESRLHAKGSLGIGGHINPIDSRDDSLGFETYMAGVEREISEELDLQTEYTQKIIGIINDDSNDVGKVHLGIVHLIELASDAVSEGEAAISDLTFDTITDIKNNVYTNLETWSQFCFDEISK